MLRVMTEDDGRMKYAMLGEDRETDDEKIAKYSGEVGWSYLRPHFEKGNLLWVDPALDLKTVAKAFTDDRSEEVAGWLGKGDLVRVGELHAEQWDRDGGRFMAVVVSPFVLMQDVPNA